MSGASCDPRPHTTCFILAGGLGERLRPLTLSVPKPLLHFGGFHRLLDFTLANVVNSSVSQSYVLTQYLADSVGTYLRSSAYAFRHIRNQPPASGKRYRSTADSVAQNLGLAPPESDLILVLSADHVYRMDYGSLIAHHIEQGAGVTVGAVPVPLSAAQELGVFSIDAGGLIVDFAEKPAEPDPMPDRSTQALSSMGVYVFDRSLLSEALADLHDRIPGPDFGRDVIPYCVERGQACAYLAMGPEGDPLYWRDVGTLQTYYDANMDALADRSLTPLSGSKLTPADTSRAIGQVQSGRLGSSIVAPSVLLGECHVERSILSPGTRVYDGAVVRDSILLPGAYIGRGASVRNAIICEGGRIEEGLQVGHAVSDDRHRFHVTESGLVVVSGLQNEEERARACPTGPDRIRRPEPHQLVGI